jgi:putative ABC transport system ATP-binding protein
MRCVVEALLVFDGVVVQRGERRILGPVDLEIPASGITVISGASGAGKTTLLRLCNGLDVASRGTISYRGHDLRTFDVLRLRREVGMVFQTPVLFGGTVRDNLAVAAAGLPERAYRAVLEQVALDPGYLDRAAGSLSGGEAQRMCLARTLVTAPQAMLLDEPTSALDEQPKLVFERTARELAKNGLPIVWVTHEPAQEHRIADRVLRISNGYIDGSPRAGHTDER